MSKIGNVEMFFFYWKTSLEKAFGDVLLGIKAILDGRNVDLLIVKKLKIYQRG